MQRFNKTVAKHAFTHTWYLYPVSIIIVALVWMWGFMAFHQPTAHEKLTIFVGAKVTDQSCFTRIKKDHYTKEGLREVTVPSSSISNYNAFTEKLKVYLYTSDILVLDDDTVNSLKTLNRLEETFVDLKNPVVAQYLSGTEERYTHNEKDFGILLKKKSVDHYLDAYMNFEADHDYYLLLGLSSKNLGSALNEKNEKHTNALTYMSYLLEGNL